VPGRWAASLDAALRAGAGRVRAAAGRADERPRGGASAVGLPAGVEPFAGGGVAGESQADRAAVAARGPPRAAEEKPELGQTGAGDGRAVGLEPAGDGPESRLVVRLHEWQDSRRVAAADPERRRRVHPRRAWLSGREVDRCPRRHGRARKVVRPTRQAQGAPLRQRPRVHRRNTRGVARQSRA
jgi:hypothetical protein